MRFVGEVSWKLMGLIVDCIFFINHACISHVICIRVAAAAEEVVYEVVAEPQEPQGQAPQQDERRENQAQGPVDPGTEQQTQGKPQCMTYYFKFMTPIYMSLLPVH